MIKKSQLKNLVKEIFKELAHPQENVGGESPWVSKSSLSQLTPEQKVTSAKMLQDEYKITSTYPSEDGKGFVIVFAKRGANGLENVEVGPDGKIKEGALAEDMTTRAELDAGTMKAVNLEAGLTSEAQGWQTHKTEKWEKIHRDTALRLNYNIGLLIQELRQKGDSDPRRTASTAKVLRDIILELTKNGESGEMASVTSEESSTSGVAGYQTPFAFGHKKKQKYVEGKIQDPEKEEMMEYLRTQYGNEEGFEDSAEVAIYWFANFNHGGQTSNLYSILSTSPFNPGRMAKGPEKGSMEEMMYNDLEHKFGSGENIQEMSSTGAVAGYQTPFAFSKNKEGSKKATDVTKKLGFKVVGPTPRM